MKRVALVATVALAVRLLYLWQIHAAPFWDLRLGDAEAYHLWAQRIAAGDWFGREVFYQAPLYPYFLALVYRLLGDAPATVRILHAALGAASCALLSYAGLELFGRRGLLAGAVLAIYPAALFLDSQLDKTALSTMLLCALLAVYAAHRWVLAGVALGLLVLTRENAVVLALPLLFVAAPRERFRFSAALLLTLAPVAARNYAVSHELHLTTAQSGPNFYIGNHAGAPGWYDPLAAGHGSAADERDDAVRLAQQAEGRSLAPGEVSRYWTGRAIGYIRAHPLDWLALIGRKLALTINNAEIADTESQSLAADYSWLLRLPLSFALVLAIAALNLRGGDRVLWSMAGLYALSVAAFYVLARYRFPLVPLLLLLAVSAPFRRPAKPAIAGALAALLIALVPLVNPIPARATNYYAIATAVSDPAQSEVFYRRALEIDPNFPGAHFGLATVLTRQERPADALPHFAAAVAAWPGHQEAHYNYAHALAALGRDEEALAQYEMAIQIRPDDPAARISFAQLLLQLNRPEEALPQFIRALDLDPNNASAHTNAGAILANEGRISEALPHFERAVQLNPADENASRNLAAAQSLLGR